MPAMPAASPIGSTFRSTLSISRGDFARIMDYFVDEYALGRTPNPCVVCNNWLKFGKLWSYGKQLEADFVATGHYAHIDTTATATSAASAAGPGQGSVVRPVRPAPQRCCRTCCFRSAACTRTKSGPSAREANLGVAEKPDSVEICFVPDNDHAGFIKKRRPELATAGNIVDRDGHVLAEHDGIEKFTIGQRKGLGFGSASRRYVLDIVPGDERRGDRRQGRIAGPCPATRPASTG